MCFWLHLFHIFSIFRDRETTEACVWSVCEIQNNIADLSVFDDLGMQFAQS